MKSFPLAAMLLLELFHIVGVTGNGSVRSGHHYFDSLPENCREIYIEQISKVKMT